jgi:hypothetical protein
VPPTNKPARISHEGRVVLLAFLAGLPGSATAIYLLWSSGSSLRYELTFTTIIVCAWLGFAMAVRERVVFPLQTLSNLLGALREGDYSVRGRSPKPDDALGEVMREVNTLGSTLREQRLGAMEATTLLRTVMREIDVAIFAFDEHQRLRLKPVSTVPSRAPCRPRSPAGRAASECAAREFASAVCLSIWW